MANNILDGKLCAQELISQLKNSIEQNKEKRTPKLIIIQVGNNPSSSIYIRNKLRVSNKAGIQTIHTQLEETITKQELKQIIDNYNNDNTIDGIIVQLPLPKHIKETEIKEWILPSKDADGFNPLTLGNVMTNNTNIYPGTPLGIVKLLKWKNIDLVGANIVIIGRSNIVGKPLANMLINESATVTVCNTKTKNLQEIAKKADILISAAGSAKLITKDFVNENMTVIDVGANFVDGIYCGDVDFDNVKDHVKWITPVPGGVGPMTIACLFENTYKLYLDHIK